MERGSSNDASNLSWSYLAEFYAALYIDNRRRRSLNYKDYKLFFGVFPSYLWRIAMVWGKLKGMESFSANNIDTSALYHAG